MCQPDTNPVIDDPAIVDFVLRRARDTAIVHVQPMAALTKGLAGAELAEIGLLKAAGAVAFTDGAKSVVNAQVMRRALTYAGDFDALVVHHTEDPDLIGDGVMNEGEFAARLGLFGIPRAAETIMLERDLRLVGLARARYHAASITCAELLGVLRRAKEAGLPVTAAVSVNHLTLNEIDIGPYRTFFKMSPPLRAEEDRLALVEALADGSLDVDHVGSQSAGRRDQAPALRRGRARRDRARDHAGRGAAPRAQRRDEARHAVEGDVDAAGRTARAAGRHAQARQPGRRDRGRYRRALGARPGPS